MPQNFKVAFTGDQGVNTNSVSVLQLIRNERADMLIISGDLGYGVETNVQSAINWENMMDRFLGNDFPVFASRGNHDIGLWDVPGGYKELLVNRANGVGANCTGNYGTLSSCYYNGLFFNLIDGSNLEQTNIDYLKNELGNDDSLWRICSWHFNQNKMQVGGKPDQVGWGTFETCREEGAIIATAHEHSYERTKTLIDITNQVVDPRWANPNSIRVAQNATFVFVSGLGGRSIRNQIRCLPTTYPYGCKSEWASIYTANQSANYGALFIEFYVDGNPRKARGYFKTIDNKIIDQFEIFSELTTNGTTPSTPTRGQGRIGKKG